MFPLAIVATFLAAAAMPLAIGSIVLTREAPRAWAAVPAGDERIEVLPYSPRPDCTVHDPMPRLRVDTTVPSLTIDGHDERTLRNSARVGKGSDTTRVYTLLIYKAPTCGEPS